MPDAAAPILAMLNESQPSRAVRGVASGSNRLDLYPVSTPYELGAPGHITYPSRTSVFLSVRGTLRAPILYWIIVKWK